MALTSGAISLTSKSATSIVLAGAVATGGSGTYTYQWYRSTGVDMSFTALSGKTTATSCTDTTVSSGVMYAYVLQTTDTGASNAPASSNIVGPVLAQGSGGSSSGIYTFSSSATGFGPVAAPTDIFNIFGSASKKVIVTRIDVSGSTSAATAISMDLSVVKRSTVGTPGSAVLTALTAVANDSNNPAATAIASTVGTANYTTLGTSVGVVAVKKLPLTLSPMTATDFPVTPQVTFTMNDLGEQGMVLNGASEQLALSLNGATLPAGTSLDINVTWEEI